MSEGLRKPNRLSMRLQRAHRGLRWTERLRHLGSAAARTGSKRLVGAVVRKR
jgi:hypothetical protein